MCAVIRYTLSVMVMCCGKAVVHTQCYFSVFSYQGFSLQRRATSSGADIVHSSLLNVVNNFVVRYSEKDQQKDTFGTLGVKRK